MRKLLKPAGVLLLVLAAAAFAASRLVDSKKADCFGGKGNYAVEACSFLAGWLPGETRAAALFRRAELYAAGGLRDKELSDLEAVAAMGLSGLDAARRPALYTAMAAGYARKGDQLSAVKYSELAVKAGAGDPAVYVSLADAYVEAGKFQQAVDLLTDAPIPPAEKKHPYYNALASAYAGGGNYAGAYNALKTGLTVKAPRPVLAATAKQMGLVCFELKRYKEAETYLGYAARAGADCPECPLLLTTIRESLGVD